LTPNRIPIAYNEGAMSPAEFTPDDLPLLNTVMRAFPHVADGFKSVIEVTRMLSFPVESPDQLSQAVGNVDLRYGDAVIPVGDLPTLMPAYYFPVESEEDFLAKIADVCARVRAPEGLNLAVSRLIEATAPSRGGTPPTISDDEIVSLARLRESPAIPSVGGIRRRNE